MDDEKKVRINNEWVSLNAIREILKIATKGDFTKSTYDVALELGGELYPELLGKEKSILRRNRQSAAAKEYIQKARLKSKHDEKEISATELLEIEIKELEAYIELENKKRQNDQLIVRLKKMQKAQSELKKEKHSEHQLITRDAYNIDRGGPVLFKGKAYIDYELPNKNNLRIRILHPDKPEHITGADLIYEHHDKSNEEVSLVFIQYKIWENKRLYLSDKRMMKQIGRLKSVTCDKGLCTCNDTNQNYRFPYCTSFLRPTDALQSANQKLISSGEHLPICKINFVKETGNNGGELLSYKSIKGSSVSGLLFEELFNREKIGSKKLSYKELKNFYKSMKLISSDESVLLYAQEFNEEYF